MRVGSGFDIHRFEDGEYLTLGGVKIPFSKGLQAHSDGDVLVHSLIDAILGAINAGDIGAHFPDDDVQYKNANSLDLLQNIYKLMSSEGYFLMNMDATIILEKPKLSKYIDKMKENIAETLSCSKDILSIKATTSEGIGFVGRQEGIACLCSILLDK
tara:strand:+ start:1241 stop:1711 length:471 start_codon:yes stop_codon:yes gene_type:complete